MYYVGKSGQQIGPFTLEQLKAKLATGEVLPTDLVWKEGMPDWKPVSTIPGLIEPEAPQASVSPSVPMGSGTGGYSPVASAPPVEVVTPTVFPPGTPMGAGIPGVGYGMPMAFGPRQNPMALTGMIVGILSVLTPCCCAGVLSFILGSVGIVFSAIGLNQIKKDPVNQMGKPMAIAGLACSILGIVLAVVFLTLGLAANTMNWKQFQQELNSATSQK